MGSMSHLVIINPINPPADTGVKFERVRVSLQCCIIALMFLCNHAKRQLISLHRYIQCQVSITMDACIQSSNHAGHAAISMAMIGDAAL